MKEGGGGAVVSCDKCGFGLVTLTASIGLQGMNVH